MNRSHLDAYTMSDALDDLDRTFSPYAEDQDRRAARRSKARDELASVWGRKVIPSQRREA